MGGFSIVTWIGREWGGQLPPSRTLPAENKRCSVPAPTVAAFERENLALLARVRVVAGLGLAVVLWWCSPGLNDARKPKMVGLTNGQPHGYFCNGSWCRLQAAWHHSGRTLRGSELANAHLQPKNLQQACYRIFASNSAAILRLTDDRFFLEGGGGGVRRLQKFHMTIPAATLRTICTVNSPRPLF